MALQQSGTQRQNVRPHFSTVLELGGMGGSSSKAKDKEKEREKEKGPKQPASQQHRVTPVAKKLPDAAAGATPQPSPRQAASAAAAAARASAPAAAPPSATATSVRPSTLESPGHSNNSLLDECASEWRTVAPLAVPQLQPARGRQDSRPRYALARAVPPVAVPQLASLVAWPPGAAATRQAPGRATYAGRATEPPS